jgi:hypothetical protein
MGAGASRGFEMNDDAPSPSLADDNNNGVPFDPEDPSSYPATAPPVAEFVTKVSAVSEYQKNHQIFC